MSQTKQKHAQIFEDIIPILMKMAMNSQVLHKHAAAIIYDSQVFTGTNRYTRQLKLSKSMIQPKLIKKTIHAEMDALLNVPKNIKKCKGVIVLVIRISKGHLRNSRPCNNCLNKLKQLGVEKVYYSDENGNIVFERVNLMPYLHISSGYKYKYT